MSRGAHAAHANRSARNVRNARNTRTRRQPQQAWNAAAPNAGDGGRAGGYGTRATFAAPRLTFLNALRAEICKALSLKSTYVLLIINALLLPAGSALMAWAMAFLMSLDPATGTTTDDPQPVAESYMWGSASAFVPTCLLVTGILGVMAVTVEYSSSTIQSSLTANPRRVMFLNAKTLVTAALAFVSSLVGLLLAWAAAYALLSPVGMTPLADGEHALPWVSILGGALLLTAMAVLGVGLGGLCRSTMGGVFALVGLLIIAPSALSMASLAGDRFAWLQSLARCLPDQAVGNVLTAGVDVAVSSSSTNVSVDVEAMNTAAGSAAGASAGSVAAADAAAASDPSGLFDPTWWQSGLIVLAWMAVAYIIGMMVVRRPLRCQVRPVTHVSRRAHIVEAMPTFTREEIMHLGNLARIALTDEEIARLQGELNVIADAINKVQEVAGDDVPPTANPVPLEAYLRPDEAETPLTQEEAVSGAPVSESGMFVAPRILGEE